MNEKELADKFKQLYIAVGINTVPINELN